MFNKKQGTEILQRSKEFTESREFRAFKKLIDRLQQQQTQVSETNAEPQTSEAQIEDDFDEAPPDYEQMREDRLKQKQEKRLRRLLTQLIYPFQHNFCQRLYHNCYRLLRNHRGVAGSQLGQYLTACLVAGRSPEMKDPLCLQENIRLSNRLAVVLPSLLEILALVQLARIPLKVRFG